MTGVQTCALPIWFLSEIILNVLKLNETRVIWLANNITDFVIGFLYFWLMETFTGGKTIGKYILKIRTVDQKSLEPTTPKRYALNNLTKSTLILILDVLFGLILREDPDKKQIRHTQLLSQTVVIKE